MKIIFVFLLLGLSILPSTSNADITSNLDGWYKFDEGTGTATSADSSGNGRTMTLVGSPSWVTGKIGPFAIGFNGSSQYALAGANFNYTSSDFTVAYWIYLNSYSTNSSGQGPIPIYKGGYQSNGYYSQINQNSPHSIIFFTNQSGADQSTDTGTNEIPLTTWTHVAYVRNGSSVRIYINGVDKTVDAGIHINPSSSSDSLAVGDYIANGILMNGYMDDVRLYSRALTASDITQLYNYPGLSDPRTVINNAKIGNAIIN